MKKLAREGLNVATDVFKPHVVLWRSRVLFALFAIQSRCPNPFLP
jgi:K+ transporter